MDTKDVHAWLAAASERAAKYIRWSGLEEVERGASMHDGSKEEAQASTAATEANTERDASAILLLPSAVRALAPLARESGAVASVRSDDDRDDYDLVVVYRKDLRAAARVLADLEALAAREGEARS